MLIKYRWAQYQFDIGDYPGIRCKKRLLSSYQYGSVDHIFVSILLLLYY